VPATFSLPLPAAHALRRLGRDLALARRKRGISTADMAARSRAGRASSAGANPAPAKMSVEVHIDWRGQTHFAGRLHPAQRGTTVTFEYEGEWLAREDSFAIDPTSLPLRPGPHHNAILFGAMQDCGPDRWGRLLIERAVRKQILERKPYQDLDYVLTVDDIVRIGALRFRADPRGPFLAASQGKLPPLIELAALLRAPGQSRRSACQTAIWPSPNSPLPTTFVTSPPERFSL